MIDQLVRFIRDHHHGASTIPLHAPLFTGNERAYVLDAIDSTFVSSVGAYVGRFENEMKSYTGSEGAVAMVNGTAALHLALRLAGVRSGDMVITQALTFVATCNAISYCGAEPVLLDVDPKNLGLSAEAVSNWLQEHAMQDDQGVCRHKADGRVVRAMVPMHTFGHPADLVELQKLATHWGLELIEDAAESLGSFYHDQHLGTFGAMAALSFNGNKIITTGGGGMLLCKAPMDQQARHLSTTAKLPHAYDFDHDVVGYNYRLPNLNAAMGCAQLERIEGFIQLKRELASRYQELLSDSGLQFVREPENARSNYWLNAVICDGPTDCRQLLQTLIEQGIQARPVWRLMHTLPMYRHCPRDELRNASWLAERLLNLPSSVAHLTCGVESAS
jgi:aminotransferase in exopolysaccharide biosynthesis